MDVVVARGMVEFVVVVEVVLLVVMGHLVRHVDVNFNFLKMFIPSFIGRNPKSFDRPKRRFLKEVGPELEDYFGKHYSNLAVHFEDKHWFVKSTDTNPTEKSYAKLTLHLAEGWLNIPEVHLLGEEEFFDLRKFLGRKLDKSATVDNTHLVRLVQDYKKEELPIQNIDQAMASEIVFSAWIGRRDAHAFNRAFDSGIPMFFDFGIAYGEEEGEFFRAGNDPGYVSNWRIYNLENENVDLISLRKLEREKGQALIPVTNRKVFDQALKLNIDRINKISSEDIYNVTQKAGFTEAQGNKVTSYLNARSVDLEETLKKIVEIIN